MIIEMKIQSIMAKNLYEINKSEKKERKSFFKKWFCRKKNPE